MQSHTRSFIAFEKLTVIGGYINQCSRSESHPFYTSYIPAKSIRQYATISGLWSVMDSEI